MEIKNGKVTMVVPEDVGNITISGVQFDIVDGFTTVPVDLVPDAETHGLKVWEPTVAAAIEAAKAEKKEPPAAEETVAEKVGKVVKAAAKTVKGKK